MLKYKKSKKIKNKDKLQLLQVSVENDLQSLAKLENFKYSRSTIFGLSLGVLFILIVSLGVYLIFGVATIYAKFGGIIIVVMSLFLPFYVAVKARELARQDKTIFEEKSKELNKKIARVCENAKKLSEVNANED